MKNRIKNMRPTTSLLLGVIMSVFCCSIGSAQIIYSNNFSLGAAANISNTPPTVATDFAGGTNTATWNDVLGTNNTGSLLANGIENTTLGDSFLLPFTPQSGYIYLLTATVTFTNNPGNWVGLGFATYNSNNVANGYARFSDSSTTLPHGFSPNGYDWVIITESSGNVQYFAGPHGTSQLISRNGFFTPGPGTHTAEVILNTTGTKWAIAAYVDGVQAATSYTYASNPTIRGAGITQNALTAPSAVQWNYLTLSTALQPFITQQPTSQSVSSGYAYTNSVVVTADTNSGSLFYQWYANGVPLANGGDISGANTNVLIINPISIADNLTNYYVVVTNNYGSATSSLASLTVYTNPMITAQFPVAYTNPITLFGGANIDGTNYVGSTPTFSVSTVGAQPLVYQWLTNSMVVDGATNASFTFTNCQFGGPTNFACVVSNSFGEASNTWSVVYLPTPVAPYPQAVLVAQPVAFWRLNESSGTLCDDYQSGNNGIYTNVTLGQTGYNPSEPTETSVLFSPGSAYYSYVSQIQNVDFAVTNGGNAEFTVEAWVYSLSYNAGLPIVIQGTYGTSEAFNLGVDTNSSTGPYFQFYVRSAGGTVYTADSSVSAAVGGGWHHLVGVCDEANGNLSLYIDGALAASTIIPANSGLYEAAAPVFIGGQYKSAVPTPEFLGYIDDVAAYSYALSAGQVIEQYVAVPGNSVPVAFVAPLPPANLVYPENQTLTIPATVSGQPPLGYYWTNLTAGGVLGSGQTSASGSLDATLTIPNASASLSGDQLELVVTNDISSTNLFVTLSAYPPPVTLDYSNPILYSNYFNGGTWSVAGMPMTAANSLVGGTNTAWVDALGTNDTGIMQANGVSATTAQDSWIVPFTPHSGYVYTVTASLTFSGNPGTWVGLGFAQRVPTNAAVGYGRFSDGGTTPPQQGPNGYDWMILTEGNGNVQYFEGPGGSVQITNKTPFFTAGTGTHTVQIVLDTTGTKWVQYAYVDGVSAGTNTYGSNPPIGAVGITQNNINPPGYVQWNYFALSQEAPGGVPPYLLDPLPPTSVTLLADTSLSLPATAFGSAPFGYYWSNTNTAAVLESAATNDMAPLGANLTVADVPASWNGNTLALTVTNAYGTNISLVSLTVTNAVNTNPTNIVFSVTGNQMTLSWPADHTGWTLQAQTNDLSVGLNTNWVDLAGSTSTNQFVVPINPTNGSVFYRLILQ